MAWNRPGHDLGQTRKTGGKNILKKRKEEEGERKRWETLERTGKRYVRHHPLIDYNYIETKEVSENDEESAKRVKELEKLLEKTNTFPEVSILPK